MANSRKFVETLQLVFAENQYVMADIGLIVRAMKARGIDFSEHITGESHPDCLECQKRYLHWVLRHLYDTDHHRVIQHDRARKEWIHLPGLLYQATKEDHRSDGGKSARLGVIQRLKGVIDNLRQNTKTSQVRVQYLKQLVAKLQAGEMFEQPELPGFTEFTQAG